MIDSTFHIATDQFRLAFAAGRRADFLVRHEGSAVVIVYPPHTDFVSLQPWLFKVVMEALRLRARQLLPARLHELARQHGFSYTRVAITSARTRWGSCSSQGHISLSLFLMILPQRLSDYVLLHELCHTREMKHGPRFWQLLDRVTGQQAHVLSEALRDYPSPFLRDSHSYAF